MSGLNMGQDKTVTSKLIYGKQFWGKAVPLIEIDDEITSIVVEPLKIVICMESGRYWMDHRRLTKMLLTKAGGENMNCYQKAYEVKENHEQSFLTIYLHV